MTAVAMAESGGNGGARNPHGEDSRGLWQINLQVHPEFNHVDLYNPVQNAKAAFAVSEGGTDISPWTTTHGGLSARYLRYRAQAESAAMSYGDGPGHGMWAGTTGYGDHASAGPGGGHHGPGQHGPGHSAASSSGSDAVNVQAGVTHDPAGSPQGHQGRTGEQYGIPIEDSPESPLGMSGGTPGGPGGRAGADYGIPLETQTAEPAEPSAPDGPESSPADEAKLRQFLNAALAQTGDKYIFGAETRLDDPNPSVFDCSELVEWAAHQAGVQVPDGAWAQYSSLHDSGTAISVQQAIDTPGALLFSFSSDPLSGHPKACHVAISLGNGKTIEAMGTQYGVGSWAATKGRFQYAALIPGLAEGGGPPPEAAEAAVHQGDAFDYRLAADPNAMDTEPATVAASLQLTEAAPPGQPPPEAQPEHDATSGHDAHTHDHDAHADMDIHDLGHDTHVGTDANVDGVDDALAQAMHSSDQPHDPDHSDDAFAAH